MNLIDRSVMFGARQAMARSMTLAGSVDTLPPPPTTQPVGLYLHIPFCESLCPFCPFHRVRFDADLAQRYTAALRQELETFASCGYQFGSVYVGGGTPTVLAEPLAALLLDIRARWDIRSIAVETNPNHLREQYLAPLRDAGVDRLSVGVQTFDNRLLQYIGRLQPYGDADTIQGRLEAVRGGFATINIDMIFNLPGQSEHSLSGDLARLQSLQLDQVSYYPLMPTLSRPHPHEAGQPPTVALPADFARVPFRQEKRFYELLCSTLLTDHIAASPWCFNRTAGAIDEYIVNEDHYVGLGSGAFSLLGNQFLAGSFSIPDYIDRVAQHGFGQTRSQQFSAGDLARYRFLVKLFGLRWPHADLERLLGRHWRAALAPWLQAFRLLGAVRDGSDALQVTERGRYLWLVMMREFLMRVNHYRRQMTGS